MTFFFQFPPEAPEALANSPTATLVTKWLVCSNICIPGEESLALNFNHDLSQVRSSPQHYIRSPEQLQRALDQLPKPIDFPQGLELSLAQKQDSPQELWLYFALERSLLPPHPGGEDVLFPLPQQLLEFQREELFTNSTGKLFGRIAIHWNGPYLTPPRPLPADGVFRPPIKLSFLFTHPQTNKRNVIHIALDRLALAQGDHDNQDQPLAANHLAQFYHSLQPFSPQVSPPPPLNLPHSLWSYLLLAFVGGLILNFMPCVLPVISLKLFSLIKNPQATGKQLLAHNAAYTLGVLLCFLSLATAVTLIKSSGQYAGWGFQLQSPLFVGSMVLSLFLFALNLFGLFEFRLPGGGWSGNLAAKEGLLGDMLSGVFATILSTPCSAPFLGTALTFAFSSSTAMIFLIFLCIGLGLSTPFLVLAVFPRSLSLLPRPGKWMEQLKKFLGLTLLLTMIWLYDIFLSLIDSTQPALILNLTLISLFFALYFHHRMGSRPWFKILFYLVPVMLFIFFLDHQPTTDLESEKQPGQQHSSLSWQPWSEQAMQQLRGQWVFIDFTAQWCFTCKVNEKLVLETSGFRQLVQSKGVKLLLADWTKRDAAIASFLQRHGYVGVPVYFIQKPDGQLVSLGEIITLQEIARHLP